MTPAARDTAITALVTRHLAALATVPGLTDLSTTRAHAERLAARVRWFDRNRTDALGMLGPNGIGPAIDSCVRSARRDAEMGRDAA